MADMITGISVITVSGLVMGTSPWPLKLMKRFKYEQFGFISMLFALLVIPWTITLISCPHILSALSRIEWKVLLLGNIFSLTWGVAQVLAMLCFIRIGVSLTYGILCAIGGCVGVVTPMIFKASGVFSTAPDLYSQAGLIILAGMFVMLIGVFFASLAGFGRENQMQEDAACQCRASGNFIIGLIMVMVAGILSAGWGFAFSYSQNSIVKAMTAQGASAFAANISVWAFVLFGAGLINVLYPAWLMTKNRSWYILATNKKEIVLSLVYGILFFIPSALLGIGMIMLGALGASVGWGIVQSTLILGGQILGFSSGEWHEVVGKPRIYIFLAIVVLCVAVVIMALGNSLVESGT